MPGGPAADRHRPPRDTDLRPLLWQRAGLRMPRLRCCRPATRPRTLRRLRAAPPPAPCAPCALRRRPRRRARGGDASTSADSGARTRIRVALELACWLAGQRCDLATATQPDIDRWITQHPTRAQHARAFLAWARDR